MSDQVQFWQEHQQWQAFAATSVQQDQPPHSEMNMKLKDVLNSKFLQQEDIGDGEVTATVESVKKQNVAKDDDPPEYKLTVKFREFAKPFVVNATNAKRMFKAIDDDTDNWPGNQIIVYVDPDVEFGGKIVGGIRVRGLRRSGTMAAASGGRDDDVNAKLRAAADAEDPPF